MTKIIAITNQKGGVGKTTTTINLAASLAATKRRVLLIDFDPQGNATMGCGVDKRDLKASVNDLLLGEATLEDVAVPLEEAKFVLLPANADLTAAEVQLLNMDAREQQLKKVLAPIKAQYDYILIDCPPTLNMLTINALVAATGVLVPMQCEYYALEGISALLETVEQLRATVNPNLALEGVLRTMFDGRNRLTTEVSQQLVSHFGEKLFHTVIPRNVRLAEAPSFGMPALLYDKKSAGSAAYLALAGEMLRRELNQAQAAVGTQLSSAQKEVV